MNKKIFLLFLFGWFVFVQSIQAGDVLLLRDVLKKTAEQNLVLKAEAHQIQVFSGQVLQAKEYPNPSVSALVSKIPMHQPLDGVAQDYTFQQTIPIFGKRKLQTKSAMGDLGAEQSKYEVLKLDVMKQAKEAYWNYSVANRQVEFSLENLKFQQAFLAKVQDNFRSGQATMADVTRAKVEVARVLSIAFEVKKKYQESKAQLNRLMGEAVNQNLPPPQTPKTYTLSVDEERFVAEALQHRPERDAIAKLEEGGAAKLKLAKRLAWAPDLTTQFVYQKNERNNDADDSLGGGIGMVFPFWTRYKGEKMSAQANLDFIRAEGKDLEQQIALEVHQALLDINLSQEKLDLWKNAVDEATEAARLAEQKYLEGDADIASFFQTRRDLVDVTLEYFNAMKDYNASVGGLERAVGVDLVKNI